MEKLLGLTTLVLLLNSLVSAHEATFSVSEALEVSSFSYVVVGLTLAIALTSLYFIVTTLLNEIVVVKK